MLIYLDMCSIHRPLDDESQLRVALEADAVWAIIQLCNVGHIELLSSDTLEYEFERNPHPVRRKFAEGVLAHAARVVGLSDEIEHRAEKFVQTALKPVDALHLA